MKFKLASLIGFFVCGSMAFAQEPVDFNRDIRPLLSDKCFLCHGPDVSTRKAGLRLDVEAEAHQIAVSPGSLDDSEMWTRINSDDENEIMPPPNVHKELTKEEIELIGRWIESGAKYQQHWAYRAPQKPDVPQSDQADFNSNPIDAFAAARMKSMSLKPSPRAAREILIRRASLDLIGLPPTREEVAKFVSDGSLNAYEKVIDRLLASPHYGERLAIDWLDVARYGDTSVFHADGFRDMWHWRDWVIKAFNENMPYDDFTIKQLAGDLLPDSTIDDKVASGFNRNNASTDEGGLIEEEYRVEYAVDRVKTTSMVWLGLSMECAQCHDHKFDPISQEEYYKFFAFFNQAADPGKQDRIRNQAPLVKILDHEKESQIPAVEDEISTLRKSLENELANSVREFNDWLPVAYKTDFNAKIQPTGLTTHFPLDDFKDGKVYDTFAPDYLAQIHGDSILFEKGHAGKAFRTNNEVYVTSESTGDSLEFDQPFSYGCWIMPQGSGGAPFARMKDGDGHRGFDLFMNGDNPAAHIIHRWPDNAIKVSSKKPINQNRWSHVFATYNGSGKAAGFKLYIDGQLMETNTEADGLSDTIKTIVPFTIGRRTSGSVFTGLVDDIKIFNRELSAEEIAAVAGTSPIAELVKIDPYWRTEDETRKLHTEYLRQNNPSANKTLIKLDERNKQLEALNIPLTTVMVMKDVPEMRQTFVLNRGQYDSPDENRPVGPDVPLFLPTLSPDLPKNRLGMAQWITDPNNPLTGRVTVNRFWKTFFGLGLVESAEDFGSQGHWPSHPELLDWLAIDFVESGWDVKRLVKMIVMSETYCQSSRIESTQFEIDPRNVYLSRGTRFRLAGEIIRDQALAISGLLNQKIGGPGVKPYQPPGLWNEVSLDGNLRFIQDHGDKLYRRSLYTYWKRSAPHPAMTLFDAPTREKCTIRRGVTNTPLQALVLMNDPQFMEASRMFAERIIKEGGDTIDSRIEFAFETATARKPDDKTVEVLKKAYETELATFSQDLARAEKLLSVGEKPRDKNLDADEHATWTIIGSMILNLDETISRG